MLSPSELAKLIAMALSVASGSVGSSSTCLETRYDVIDSSETRYDVIDSSASTGAAAPLFHWGGKLLI